MSVKLSPFLNETILASDGTLAVGYKIYTYVAGSVNTNQTSYTDITGVVPQSNPIITNARGQVDNPIWLTAGLAYKLRLFTNLDVFTGVEYDNVTGVNDSSATLDQWLSSNVTPTYISATQFSVPGDQTSNFQLGRRVKLTVTAGTVYGQITASAFTTLTTVTVSLDSGALDSGLSAVSYGILTPNNTSLPAKITVQSINTGRSSIVQNATTMDLYALSNTIDGTGSALQVTAIVNAPQAGAVRTFYPLAFSIIKNNAMFAVDGGADYTSSTGDAWIFEAITTSTYKVHIIKADGTPIVVPTITQVKIRQTIIQQASAPLVIGTGLAVNLAATATPFRVAIPAGVGASGNIDYITSHTADVTGYWSGLTANVINYLFEDRNTGSGVATGVASTLPYIAQNGGSIAVTSGQHTYDYSTGTMYLGNGATAPAVQRTAVGECLAGAATITTVTPYATLGFYVSAYTATLPSSAAVLNFAHNIGNYDNLVTTYEMNNTTTDAGYAVGDTVDKPTRSLNASTTASPLNVWKTRNNFGSTMDTAATNGWVIPNKATGVSTTITQANWRYRFLATRGF